MQIAIHTHEAFLRHPRVGALAAARTAQRENEFRSVERKLDCMRRAGLDDAEAARYYRVFADLVLAYSAMDASLAALPPPMLMSVSEEAARSRWGTSLPYPRLRRPHPPRCMAAAAGDGEVAVFVRGPKHGVREQRQRPSEGTSQEDMRAMTFPAPRSAFRRGTRRTRKACVRPA
ncbi:TetR/AcrR family transcriptional regulator C-terminal domain-containing protein [Streptomyces sp. NPDC049541]|uniref:TetR/AcrR family transcriptional regulator C-terminal domain-containing protein n=1 Tax=Streptomyces sp. NPDC049541 TaxID=3365594 RepID=UPI0037A522AA